MKKLSAISHQLSYSEKVNLRQIKTISEKRKLLEEKMHVSLKNIGHFSLDESIASSRNCENMIGVAQVPMGVAGPLVIADSNPSTSLRKRNQKSKSYFIPLATTEGALVASINRGCKATNESGGVVVRSHRAGVTRGPVFDTGSIVKGHEFEKWLQANEMKLADISESTSHHLKFLKYQLKVIGPYSYIRFYFDTQDAMGMNMVTIATQKIIEHIEKETSVKCISIAGNFDIDKKPAWSSMIYGRGIEALAEVKVPEAVVKRVLKTNIEKIHEVWLAKCMVGSALSGSIGFNAHFANVIAAIFIATGQDPAHVVEGSVGITTTHIDTEMSQKYLYLSVYLPSLMLGTVGGGTGLATQKEALNLMGVMGGDKGKNALRFAEIAAAAVLCGELSLLASLAQNSLAKSHQRLGRGSE